jgi:hypothetical protein
MVSALNISKKKSVSAQRESLDVSLTDGAETQKNLTRLLHQTETQNLSHEAAHMEVENLNNIFNKALSYDKLSWIERKIIKSKTYKKGMDLFFVNLHNDIDSGELRSFDAAVTAATKAISKTPKKGVQVKATMLDKIRTQIPEFETRYKQLRLQINNPEPDAV